MLQKEQEAEAQRRMDVEVRHQKEEAETGALARKMMSDANKNRSTLNSSCCKLLNNYQGKLYIYGFHLYNYL